MNENLQALSAREKETLRLLLGGHDAKSIARHLGLSVYTVNERLRDARRKLGVSSSREAARILGVAERGAPDSLGDKEFGVAQAAPDMRRDGAPHRRQGAVYSVAWLSGGMLVMSLIVTAIVLSSALHGNGAVTANHPSKPPVAAGQGPIESAGLASAQAWVVLLDAQRWEASWQMAATMFKSQLSAAQWTSTVKPVREPLGAVSSRVLDSATKSTSLPGAPAGEYEILQFRTRFANRPDAVETVILAHEGAAWKVAGYFIR
jgi:DNA-binding CsgD family transcriptional regulator